MPPSFCFSCQLTTCCFEIAVREQVIVPSGLHQVIRLNENTSIFIFLSTENHLECRATRRGTIHSLSSKELHRRNDPLKLLVADFGRVAVRCAQLLAKNHGIAGSHTLMSTSSI